MSRSHVITLVKLLAVAGLLAFVFANVQWDDQYIQRDAATGEETAQSGKIVGPWDAPEVRWRALDENGEPGPESLITPGADNGTNHEVTPGFFTFVLNLDWQLFAAGALCYALSVIFAATRWWWLLRVNGLQVTVGTTVRYTWIGLFFNNLVPGLTGGDVVKALYIMKHCHGARVPALVSVMVDRILGLGSLALLGAIVVLFALDRDGFGLIALGIWGVLAAVAFMGTVAFSRRIRRAIRLDELINKLPTKLGWVLRRLDQAISFYRNHKGGIVLWMFAGMANHACSVASVLLIGMALRVGMGPLDYFVLVPIINIVSAFPIAPAGWGVGELLFRELFGTFGAGYLTQFPYETAVVVMGTRGVALSVLFRIHLTLWSLLGGLLMLLEKDRVTRKDLEEEVALEEEEAAHPEDSSTSSG